MGVITHRITLDLVRETDAVVYGLKKGENAKRLLKINLLSGGDVYKLSEDEVPRLLIKKPDNTIVFRDCTVSDNVIEFDLSTSEQVTAVSGTLDAELVLYTDENSAKSCRFKFFVDEPVVDDNDVVSKDEYQSLEKVFAEAKELAQDSSKAKENYDSAKALYDENVASVGSAKTSADDASASAKSADESAESASDSAERAKSYYEQTKEIADGVDGVRYNSKQELTEEQKAQARGNIGAYGSVGEIPYNDTLETDENNLLGVKVGNGLKKSEYGVELDSEIFANAEEFGLATTVNLGEHNVNVEAHNDIRLLVAELTARINALLDCDDTTLDQTSEIVAYIKANKELIDSITTSKVNVGDIIDNLTTNVSDKPLSAKQGILLKSLIDAITVPTKLSELNNDTGFITEEEFLPRNIRITGYDDSSVTVEFETGNGNFNMLDFDVDLSIDGKFDVYIYKIAIDGGGYGYSIASETIENSVARIYAFTYVVANGIVTYLSTDGVNYLLEEQKADKEGKFETFEKEVEITEDIKVYEFADLNLLKATIFITFPAVEASQSGYLRVNGKSSAAGDSTQVGFLYNFITTAENRVVIELEKQNGIIKGNWTIAKTSTGFGTFNRGLKPEQIIQGDENINQIWLVVNGSNTYFPIGTKITMIGVRANENNE